MTKKRQKRTKAEAQTEAMDSAEKQKRLIDKQEEPAPAAPGGAIKRHNAPAAQAGKQSPEAIAGQAVEAARDSGAEGGKAGIASEWEGEIQRPAANRAHPRAADPAVSPRG